MSSHKPTVSVAICTRNRGKRLIPAIESILANNYPAMELLIVDQSTNGETREACEQFTDEPRLRYISTDTRGTGIARDIALRASDAKYLLFTDDDCNVPEDWVEVMTAICEEHPETAVLFCRVEPVEYDWRTGYTPHFPAPDEDQILSKIADFVIGTGIGAGMALRREAILALGGFDHHLGPGSRFRSGEDLDIALRAVTGGWHVRHTSRTTVIHDGFRSWSEFGGLVKSDWTATGAVLAKYSKCHPGRAVFQVVQEFLIRRTLIDSFTPLRRGRRPQGFKRHYYGWQGYFRGLATPVGNDKRFNPHR